MDEEDRVPYFFLRGALGKRYVGMERREGGRGKGMGEDMRGDVYVWGIGCGRRIGGVAWRSPSYLFCLVFASLRSTLITGRQFWPLVFLQALYI